MAETLATVRYLDQTEALIASGPELRGAMQSLVDDIAEDSGRRAPKDTTRGAASIHGIVRRVPAGWEGRVSWTRQHYYMYMQHEGWDTGNGRKPGRPFIREAAQARRDNR